METTIKLLSPAHIDQICGFTNLLNPELDLPTLRARHQDMFNFENYKCFGLFEGDQLVGLSSGWITVKLYSGKQLEVDNVIIDPNIQSKGYGGLLLKKIEEWSKEEGCLTVELNTYVVNHRSHKFYFNQGYNILGYHFLKHL